MKRLLKDIFILQLGTAGTTITGIVTSFLIAKILQPSNYGIYALVFSLYSLVSIFGNFGVNTATVIKFSEAHARKDKNKIFGLLSSFIKISLIIGIIMWVLGFTISPYLAKLLYTNRKIGELARPLFLMALLGILYKFVVVILQGTRQIRKLTILENLFQINLSILVITLLLLGYGINGAIWGWIVATFLSSLLAIRIYKRVYESDKDLPYLFTLLKYLWNVKLKPYFKFNFSVALSDNLETLYEILPIMLLGIFIIPKEVGYFKFGYSIISLLILSLEAISRNLSVRLPEAKGKNNIKEFKELFLKVSLYSGLASILMMIIILITSPLIIRLWMKEYIPSIKIIYILSIYFAMYGFWVGLSPIFKTLERVDVEIKLNFLGIILWILLGSILIRSMGITGAAVAIVIVGLVTKLTLYIKAIKILEETELLWKA